jgi:hypothetical protein
LNYAIKTNSIKQEYLNLLNLGTVCKTIYNETSKTIISRFLDYEFSIISSKLSLSHIDHNINFYDKFSSARRQFPEVLHLTKNLEKISRHSLFDKNQATNLINNNKHKIQDILKFCKDSVDYEGNEELNEINMEYLCNVYEYNGYDNLFMWKLKGYSFLSCYVLSLVVCSPVICLCCPCLTLAECGSIMDTDNDHLPTLCSLPCKVCDTNNRNTYSVERCIEDWKWASRHKFEDFTGFLCCLCGCK